MRTRARTRLIVLFRRRMMASLRYGLRNRSDIDSRNGLVIDTRDPDIPARQLETRQNKVEGEKNAGHVSAGNVHRANFLAFPLAVMFDFDSIDFTGNIAEFTCEDSPHAGYW
jgi:hypothetical protein